MFDCIEIWLAAHVQLVRVCSSLLVALLVVYAQIKYQRSKDKANAINKITYSLFTAHEDMVAFKSNYLGRIGSNMIDRAFTVRGMINSKLEYDLAEEISYLLTYSEKRNIKLDSISRCFNNVNALAEMFKRRDEMIESFLKNKDTNKCENSLFSGINITFDDISDYGVNNFLNLLQINERILDLIDRNIINIYNNSLHLSKWFSSSWIEKNIMKTKFSRYLIGEDDYEKYMRPIVKADLNFLKMFSGLNADIVHQQFSYGDTPKPLPYPNLGEKNKFTLIINKFFRVYTLAFFMMVYVRVESTATKKIQEN